MQHTNDYTLCFGHNEPPPVLTEKKKKLNFAEKSWKICVLHYSASSKLLIIHCSTDFHL